MNMDLSTREQKHLEELIANAERNKVEAQQLALDAGKLLTITSDRLDEHKDKGFFKRCWYKISGKQGELDRANQKDLIEMQKYAWFYLMRLQEQNLIQAQAIAVIRNNLKDVANEIAEINDMISTIIEKFDARITKLEQVTALIDWSNAIEARDDFQHESPLICSLQLTFDYLAVLQANGIQYSEVERRPDIRVAFKKCGIMCDERLTVEGFISRLFDEIQSLGYRLFRKIITLHVNEKEIDSKYILDNVSGAGYNALYRFEQEMDHMENMSKHLKKDDPYEVMLVAIRSVLNNPQTEYSIIELAKEILCGSLLTEEIFREENGITDTADSETTANKQFAIESLLGQHVTITYHAFLNTSPTDEEKVCYIESFSLLFAALGGITERQQHYITAISELFDCDNCLERIELLTINPKNIDIKSIISTLSNPNRQYAWFVDTMYIGNCGDTINPQTKVTILQMCKVLNFKENEISPFLEYAEKLATEKNPAELFQAIRNVNNKTDAWKTILDFRRLSLKGAFDEIRKKLNTVFLAGTKLSLEIVKASMPVNDCGFVIGDENLLQRTAISVARLSCISKFKEQKVATEKFEESAREVIYESNNILSLFGTKCVNYSGNLYNINADETTSISNENWGDNMHFAIDKLNDFIEQITNVSILLEAQLNLYEEGKYYESAVENSKKQKQEAEEKRKDDEEKKKKVSIAKGDSSATLSIKFEKLDNLPFDYEDIQEILSNGYTWFALAKQLWTSEDGKIWNKIKLPIDDLSGMEFRHIDSTLILWKTYGEDYHYSTDGKIWETGKFPKDSSNEDLFFSEGKWYLQSRTDITYSYVKEGIIWDSNETGYCKATQLYTAKKLSENWQKLDSEFSFPEGVYISTGALGGTADGLVALCAYDYSYRNDKHITNQGAHFVYATGKKGWQSASFPVDTFRSFDVIDNEVNGRFLCCKSGIICASAKGIFISEDGKLWEKTDDDFSFYSPAFLNIGNLICIYNRGKMFYVSTDGKIFHEMLLEYSPESMSAMQDTIMLANTSNDEGGLYIGKIQLST